MTWQAVDFPTQVEYARFIGDFRARTLPKPRWTHHAHLAVALWYLHGNPPALALLRIRADICAYNEAVGVTNTDSSGYHETLTQLFMRGVLAHRRGRGEESLLQSLRALLDSPMGQSDWPLRFYSRQRLMSVEARRGWVEPDLDGPTPPWSRIEDHAFAIAPEPA